MGPVAADPRQLSLLQILGILWRGKWVLAGCMLLAALLAGYYAFFFSTPRYVSSVKIVLDTSNDEVLEFREDDSELPAELAAGLAAAAPVGADPAVLNTEIELMRARLLIEVLIDRLGLLSDPEFNPHLRPQTLWSVQGLLNLVLPPQPPPTERAIKDAVIDEVLGAISIINIRESYVFRIGALSESPSKAALIANTLAALYIEDQVLAKFQVAEQASIWLTDQVGRLQTELKAAEIAAQEFSAAIELISPEALAVLNWQLKELRRQGAAGQRNVALLSARIARMEQAAQSGDILTMAAASEEAVLEATAAELVAELAANSDTDPNTGRQDFDRQFSDLLGQLQIRRARAATQLAALEASVAPMEQKIAAQSADLVRLQQLERDVAAAGLIYQYSLARLKETTVQQGLQQPDSRMLSYAVIARQPTRPRRPLVLVFAAFAGFLLGTLLILTRELRQNGFRSADDMAAVTGVAVFGEIPRAPSGNRKKLLDYIVSQPTSALAEAVRNLRTSILLSDADNPPQVIMTTSSVPGEGKTTQTLALAHNLSAMGRKVLVIEADIRRRSFRAYFDVQGDKSERGFVGALLEEAPVSDLVWRSELLGIDILLGGRSARNNAADLFSSERFRTFLADRRQDYDVILIDTPPVLVVPDARVIAHAVDIVVYMVHWDKTPRSQVLQGMRAFETVGVDVTGLVLSQVDPRGMRRYGGKYGEAYTVHGEAYYGNEGR